MKKNEDELPRFGSIAKDPLQDEHEKIESLVADLLHKDKEDPFKGKQM